MARRRSPRWSPMDAAIRVSWRRASPARMDRDHERATRATSPAARTAAPWPAISGLRGRRWLGILRRSRILLLPRRSPNREDDDPQSRDAAAGDDAGPRAQHDPGGAESLVRVANRSPKTRHVAAPQLTLEPVLLAPGRFVARVGDRDQSDPQTCDDAEPGEGAHLVPAAHASHSPRTSLHGNTRWSAVTAAAIFPASAQLAHKVSYTLLERKK